LGSASEGRSFDRGRGRKCEGAIGRKKKRGVGGEKFPVPLKEGKILKIDNADRVPEPGPQGHVGTEGMPGKKGSPWKVGW